MSCDIKLSFMKSRTSKNAMQSQFLTDATSTEFIHFQLLAPAFTSFAKEEQICIVCAYWCVLTITTRESRTPLMCPKLLTEMLFLQ